MGGRGFSKIKISFSRAFWSAIFFDHDDDFLRLKLSILRLGTLFDHRGATFQSQPTSSLFYHFRASVFMVKDGFLWPRSGFIKISVDFLIKRRGGTFGGQGTFYQDLGSVLLKNQNKYPLFSSSTFNFLPVPLNFSMMKIRHPTQRSRIFKNQYLTQLFDQYFYFFRGNTFLNQTKTFSYHGQFLRLRSTFLLFA